MERDTDVYFGNSAKFENFGPEFETYPCYLKKTTLTDQPRAEISKRPFSGEKQRSGRYGEISLIPLIFDEKFRSFFYESLPKSFRKTCFS